MGLRYKKSPVRMRLPELRLRAFKITPNIFAISVGAPSGAIHSRLKAAPAGY
jgi:hypothetical protein